MVRRQRGCSMATSLLNSMDFVVGTDGRCTQQSEPLNRLARASKKDADTYRRYKSEACGHCCTCRWWEMDPWNETGFYGTCHIRSIEEFPAREACDWCGEYDFWEWEEDAV